MLGITQTTPLGCASSPEGVEPAPAKSLACGHSQQTNLLTTQTWNRSRCVPTTQPTQVELALMAFLQRTYIVKKKTRRQLILGSGTQAVLTSEASPGTLGGSEEAGVLDPEQPKEPWSSGKGAAVGVAAVMMVTTPAGSLLQAWGMEAPAVRGAGFRIGSCPHGSQRSSYCTASAAPL